MKFTPANCPHCEYDRRFPDTDMGGWIYFGNNGPFAPCGLCNANGSHPRISVEDTSHSRPVRAATENTGDNQ